MNKVYLLMTLFCIALSSKITAIELDTNKNNPPKGVLVSALSTEQKNLLLEKLFENNSNISEQEKLLPTNLLLDNNNQRILKEDNENYQEIINKFDNINKKDQSENNALLNAVNGSLTIETDKSPEFIIKNSNKSSYSKKVRNNSVSPDSNEEVEKHKVNHKIHEVKHSLHTKKK